MSGYVNITSPAREPEFKQAWRADDGTARASVHLGDSWITFDGPALARAVAAEILKAAGEMEALPPAQDGGQS